MMQTALFYVDLETTGCPGSGSIYNANNRTCQLSSVAYNGATFNHVVNPEVHIPAESTAIHRITNTMARSAPTFKTAFPLFRRFIHDNTPRGSLVVIVAHNAFGFDQLVLQKECDRCNLRVPCHWYFYDTLPIYRRILPAERSKKLGDLYFDAFGVTLEGAHDALADSVALKALFERDLSTVFNFQDCVPANSYVYLPDEAPADAIRGIGKASLRKLNRIFKKATTVGDLRALMSTYANGEIEKWIRTTLNQHAEAYVYSIWLEITQGGGELPHRMFSFFPFMAHSFNAVMAPHVLKELNAVNIRSAEQLKRQFMYNYKQDKVQWDEWVNKVGASKFHIQMILNSVR